VVLFWTPPLPNGLIFQIFMKSLCIGLIYITISYYFEMTGRSGKTTKARIPLPVREEIDRCGGTAGLLGRMPKERDLESIALLHNALSDVIRLKILFLLGVQPLCVCVIRELVGVSDSRLSYHLNILKRAGLIRGEQQGSWIIYSITGKGTTYSPSGEDRSYPSYYTVGD